MAWNRLRKYSQGYRVFWASPPKNYCFCDFKGLNHSTNLSRFHQCLLHQHALMLMEYVMWRIKSKDNISIQRSSIPKHLIGKINLHRFFFYNLFYKNHEAQHLEKIKNIVRIMLRLKVYNLMGIWARLIFHCTYSLPMHHLSTSPETIREPYGFLMFLGCREKVHWDGMG